MEYGNLMRLILSVNRFPPPLHPPGYPSGLKTINRHAAAQAAVAAVAAATAQLHEAASKGDLERVKAAIAAGADVDAKDKVGASELGQWDVDRGRASGRGPSCARGGGLPQDCEDR